MDAIESFWLAYLAGLPLEVDRSSLSYTAWSFGNRPDLADELGALVLAGTKTATCMMAWEEEAVPAVGDISVILDGQRSPICIIQTTQVEIKPFDEIDAQFAYEEGEGDRSYEHWREEHWRYFSRICEAGGRQISEDMPIICERFRLLYPKSVEI
jgi:uncharacterized protein YhfF